MYDYRVKDFLRALDHNVHIEPPYIVSFDDYNLHFYDMNTFTLLKRFSISNIEMVGMLSNYKERFLDDREDQDGPSRVEKVHVTEKNNVKCDSRSGIVPFYFLVYKTNNLHVYRNNSIIKKLQLKNIKQMVSTNSHIYMLSKSHVFILDYDLKIQKKLDVPMDWSLINNKFIATKDGKLYDLEMRLVSSFEKEVSFANSKDCVGFADGTFSVDKSNQIKRMKINVSGRVLYLDAKNIITEHSFNGRRTPYTVKNVFNYSKKIFLLTEDNEIIVENFVVDNDYPATDFFVIHDELFYVKDRSLRKLLNQKTADILKNMENESVAKRKDDLEEWSQIFRGSDLIISKDVLIMDNPVQRVSNFNGMIFLTDGQNIVIYYKDSVFVHTENLVIKGLCVDDGNIVFGTAEGDVHIIQNDLEKNIIKNGIKYDKATNNTFYTELATYKLELLTKHRFSAHSETITDLITTKDLIVSAERRRRVRIHDKSGNLVKEIKATSNSLVRHENGKGNEFLVITGNKIRIYNGPEMLDEVEHINDINTCILLDKKIMFIDYKGNYVLYNIGKKKKEHFNVGRVFNRENENEKFKAFLSGRGLDLCPFSMRICNNTLVFAGNFFIFIEKYKIKNKEIIINELKNNRLNINYILQYNMSVNILENLLDNRIDGIEVTKQDGMIVLSKPFLSTISTGNRTKYVNYLKKYINYSKYIGITQVLIKECLDAGMQVDYDISRVVDWVENVHRDLIGMKLLFKNKEK